MIRHITLILCVLALSSCTSTSRPCPGFGTPLADKWSTGLDIGDTITYVNDTGATIALELREREDSEPYVGSSGHGSNEVICGSSSVRRFVFENSDVALRIRLSQTQFEDPSKEAAQSFSLFIRPESPAGEAVAPGYDFGFFLGLDARQRYTDEFDLDSPNEKVSRFIENLQVGENTYPYAVENMYADLTRVTSAVANTNTLAAITRTIVAEGGGLVQFELLNGEVYSRL